MLKVFETVPGLAEPDEPYSQLSCAGELIFVAGQVAVDDEMRIVGRGDAYLQARQVWRNIAVALGHVGASVNDIAKITVFLKDMRDAKDEIRARTEALGVHRPTCTQVEVSALAWRELLMEIDAVAINRNYR